MTMVTISDADARNIVLETMPAPELRHKIVQFLMHHHRPAGHTTYEIAQDLGAAHGRDGDKARGRVSAQVGELLKLYEVEEVRLGHAKRHVRYLDFEGRQKRWQAKLEMHQRRGLAQALKIYLTKVAGVKDVVNDRESVRFDDVRELHKFLDNVCDLPEVLKLK